MGHASSRLRSSGLLYVTLTLAGWASVPLFLRYFAGYIDGWTANGWRYGLSAVLWAPLLVIGARRGTLPPGLWRAAVVPSIFNCCGQVCFAWSPYLIDPGLIAFLLRFQIVVVTLGAYLLFPAERRVLRRPRYWCGLGIVFVGSMGTILLGREPLHGATALGVGSALVTKEAVRKRDFGALQASAAEYLERVRQAREAK